VARKIIKHTWGKSPKEVGDSSLSIKHWEIYQLWLDLPQVHAGCRRAGDLSRKHKDEGGGADGSCWSLDPEWSQQLPFSVYPQWHGLGKHRIHGLNARAWGMGAWTLAQYAWFEPGLRTERDFATGKRFMKSFYIFHVVLSVMLLRHTCIGF
jgi:hypothetical protein